MAIWLATGPCAIVCLAPSSVVASTYWLRFCGTPSATSANATHDRQRQQHVERDAREIDPEVADGRRLGAAERARQRHDDGHAGRRRDEVLHGEADHLAEVGQRRLAAVALPVGVGDERHRRVEGQVLAHPAEALRVERQEALQPQDRVQQHEAGGVEHQQRRDVLEPASARASRRRRRASRTAPRWGAAPDAGTCACLPAPMP